MAKKTTSRPTAKKTVTKRTVVRPGEKRPQASAGKSNPKAAPSGKGSLPKSNPVRTSVGREQLKGRKKTESIQNFREDVSFITGAPMLDAKGWKKDVNTIAKAAKKYKLANTDKEANAVALWALKGWEPQVEKKKKK